MVIRHTQVTYRCTYRYVYRWRYIRVRGRWYHVRTLQRVNSCVRISSRPLPQRVYRRTGFEMPGYRLY